MMQTDDFNFIADFNNTALNSSGSHGTSALDAEDIFDRHQEGLILGSDRSGNIIINSFDQVAE